MTDNTQPEALRRQHTRIAELEAQIEALSGVQALSAAPAVDITTAGEMQAFDAWYKQDCVIEGAAAKMAAKAAWKAPSEQQAEPGAVDRTGCTAGTDEECTRRGCATSCPAQQAATKAAPAEPPAPRGVPVAWLNPWRADQVTTDYDAYGKHGIPLYTAPQQEAQEPVATLHCNDVGYVWARATEVGKLMRFEKPLNLYTAPQPAPAPLSEPIDQLERALAIIGVVGAIDGHDVVRRESVLEIARRAALAAQGGKDA